VHAGKIAIGLYIFHNVVYARPPTRRRARDRTNKKALLAIGYALFTVMCVGF